jgi:hypothetical protein
MNIKIIEGEFVNSTANEDITFRVLAIVLVAE